MDGKDDSGGGGGLLDWTGIAADLVALRQLAIQIRASVEATLAPRTSQAFPSFEAGATFGVTSPSVDLYALRQKYSDCLASAADQLVDQMDTSTRLVNVMYEIASRYTTTDALASATLNDLQAAYVAAANTDRARTFGAGASPAGGL